MPSVSRPEVWLACLFIAVNLTIALWDVWAWGAGKDNETVSWIMFQWSKAWPILPLVVGVVAGHVFWPQTR
jgi:hypothetical protein